MSNHKWLYLGMGAGFIALSLWVWFNLATLTRYPAPYEDDAYFASIAAQFMQTGHFGLPLYGDVYGSAMSMVHVGRLFILEFVAVFSILGVGLFQARLVGFLGALVVSGDVYLLGRDLWGHTEGVLAALVMLLSWHTFWSSHTTRPDTWLDAGGLTVILLFRLLQRKPSLKFAFGLGLAAALLLEIHLKTTLYLVPLGVGMLYNFGRQRTGWPLLLAFTIGGVLTTLSWLVIHFLPDPSLMWAQWRNGLFAELVQPSNNLFTIINDLVLNGIIYLTRLGWLEFGYLVVGVGALLVRRSPTDKFILIFLGMFTLSYLVLMPYTATAHITLFWPLVSLITGAGWVAIATKLSTWSPWPLPAGPIVSTLALLPLLLGYLVGDVVLAQNNQNIDYDSYAQQIRQYIPAQASVVGESVWWFPLQSGTYTADFFMAKAYRQINKGQAPAATFIAQVFQQRAVQFVLLDDRIGSLHSDPPSDDDSFHPDLVNYTTAHCHAIGTITDPFYDAGGTSSLKTTTIYQCP